MAQPSITSIHKSVLAWQHTPGAWCEGPIEASSDWESEEGTTVDRLRHYAAEPDPIRVTFVEDPSLNDAITQSRDPIHGLRNPGDVTIELPMGGSGSATEDASQVTETAQMRLFEAMLGGLNRGYSSAITTVNTQVSLDPTTTTGIAEGIQYGYQDNDDLTLIYPARVLTEDGSTATFDRAPPFTITTSDHLKAMAVAYIDEDALADPNDSNAQHSNWLIQKGGLCWEMLGCCVQADTLSFPRNEVPRLSATIMGTYAKVPGDLAPSAPSWDDSSNSEAGDEGQVVGARTKLHIQDVGTTTLNMVDIVAGTFVVNFGLPRVRLETGTEVDDRAQGTAGFTLAKAETIIEFQAYLDTGWQDDWDTLQHKIISYYQVSSGGNVWHVHAPNAVLMEPPQRVGAQESNCYTLRFKCLQDRSLAVQTDLARSRVTVAWG